jgi:phosphinothricin acetyltransferase
MIRDAREEDSQSISAIYNYYVLNTSITFEETPISAEIIKERILATRADGLPWIVIENEKGDVTGYAYASKWKGRCAYKYSVEITVYLHPDQGGKGLGTKLYEKLFALLKEKGFHVVIGGITLPNPASIALHEKFGLTKAGHFKEVGFKFGKWTDVGYWQGIISGSDN